MSTAVLETSETWEPLQRLDRDIREASRNMNRASVQFMVGLYYQVQRYRIMSAGQLRSQEDEPDRVLSWVFDSTRRLEEDIKKALGEFAQSYTAGAWMTSITGIGPVISSGLLAHLDITKAPTCCHFWSFAGLNPDDKWEKKTRRPWNAELKTLVSFKLGECFVKVQNKESDFYGKLYHARKEQEIARNESGAFAEQAALILSEKQFGKDTEARKWYEQGKLPPAHLHARARRVCVKLFLSHFHAVMFEDYWNKPAPRPYIFEHGIGHIHYIPPPNWPMEERGKSLRELK